MPFGVLILHISPSSAPINPWPMGESMLILPLITSESSDFTISYRTISIFIWAFSFKDGLSAAPPWKVKSFSLTLIPWNTGELFFANFLR